MKKQTNKQTQVWVIIFREKKLPSVDTLSEEKTSPFKIHLESSVALNVRSGVLEGTTVCSWGNHQVPFLRNGYIRYHIWA